MRRSFLVWVTLLALPGALACNLILGNSTPDVAREAAGTTDATASSSSSSGSPVDRDADPPALDAGIDASDDHDELPAARLVFVNGNPHEISEEIVEIPPLRAFVLREDAPQWKPPAAEGPRVFVGSPAVFFVEGRLYVVGGTVTDGSTSLLPSYVAQSAPIDGDQVQTWQGTGAFPSHIPSRCAARVGAATAPPTIDVMCGVSAGDNTSGQGVLAYASGDAGPASWMAYSEAPMAADGVVFATPLAMLGLAKTQLVGSDGFDSVSWSRDAQFTHPDRGPLPTLDDACAVSFRDQQYVIVTANGGADTYQRAADGTWVAQATMHVSQPGLQSLTCTATERGLYVAGAYTVQTQGKFVPVSVMFRALATESLLPQSWDQIVEPPPIHDPGSVLIAIPASAGDAGN